MNQKPRLKPRLTSFDWMLEAITLAAVLLAVSYTIYSYGTIPEKVARYIGITGAPVGYYNRSLIWIFPALSLLLYSLMSWVNERPYLYNYPMEVNDSNATHVYLLACRWVRLVKLIFISGMAYTTVLVIQSFQKEYELTNEFWILSGVDLVIASVAIRVYKKSRKGYVKARP